MSNYVNKLSRGATQSGNTLRIVAYRRPFLASQLAVTRYDNDILSLYRLALTGFADHKTFPSLREIQLVKPSPTKRRLVSRLIGLETEYATLVADVEDVATGDLPASQEVYRQICDAIRRDQPTATGLFDSEQMFLASGGAVTFESHPTLHALPGGLVEIATPEVRSPDELLACQRSIDDLVSDAASNIEMDIDLRILKNSSDALGHVYGCQENYETVVASGIWLLIYRMFVCVLWAMQIVSLLLSLPILIFACTIIYANQLVRHGLSGVRNGPPEMFDSIPDWLSKVMVFGFRIVHLPTVFVLRFVAKHIAFRKQRKYLTSLLISRVALVGSGDLSHDGKFRMSAKGMAIDTVADMGSFSGERPIFVYGHWLSQFCAKPFLSLTSTRRMLRRKQRLQIGLSDSNMSQRAEYVKVACVSLLLDMIEAGQTDGLPCIKSPIDSLKRITSDWNLIARVPTNYGELSAIEIQKKYLKAAEVFVESTPSNYRGESPIVLERWKDLLDRAVAFRRDAEDIMPSVGEIDWLTKHWLMQQLDEPTEWVSRKKIDLRYHELSDEGYYRRIAMEQPELRLVDDEKIAARRRSPPATSPAARRGWLIREFGNSDVWLKSDWSFAVVGRGRDRKRIEFVETPVGE